MRAMHAIRTIHEATRANPAEPRQATSEAAPATAPETSAPLAWTHEDHEAAQGLFERIGDAFAARFGALRKPRLPDVIHLPDASAAALPRRTLRKRVAVLLALVAVPAMAAQSDFGALPGGAPTEAEIVSKRLARQLAENPAMDFERPGMSFPGSAFFFLADPPADALIALPTTDALDSGAAEAGRELGELIDAGPAARPFFGAAGANGLRAQDCLAQAIWYEAASESEAGQRAVAQVVLNRVAHPGWPGSVCGVVYQGSERRTGCQFTFTCDGSLARRASGASWGRAQRIAADALAGSVYAPIGHATHYHTLWVNPYWAGTLDHVGTIGAHRFYKNRGAAGEKSAFTGRYAGAEPSVSGRTTAPSPLDTGYVSDLSVAPVPALPEAPASAAPARAEVQSAPRPPAQRITTDAQLASPALSGVGSVREDYARAGQWKSDAARAALEADERAIAAKRAESGAKKPGTGENKGAD